jgi:hypothetical protein
VLAACPNHLDDTFGVRNIGPDGRPVGLREGPEYNDLGYCRIRSRPSTSLVANSSYACVEQDEHVRRHGCHNPFDVGAGEFGPGGIASRTRGDGATVDSLDDARQRTSARPAARL